MPHAGICGGGDQQWSSLLRPLPGRSSWCGVTTKLRAAHRKRLVGRDRREPILPNRPTAQRDGGSLQRLESHESCGSA
jgi:hypothetical protein